MYVAAIPHAVVLPKRHKFVRAVLRCVSCIVVRYKRHMQSTSMHTCIKVYIGLVIPHAFVWHQVAHAWVQLSQLLCW